MKVNELEGQLLDYWVAKANGYELTHDIGDNYSWVAPGNKWIAFKHTYSPSTDWSQGGPLIERMQPIIEFVPTIGWRCSLEFVDELGCEIVGAPTLLIATMRCYVASKLGEEVE